MASATDTITFIVDPVGVGTVTATDSITVTVQSTGVSQIQATDSIILTVTDPGGGGGGSQILASDTIHVTVTDVGGGGGGGGHPPPVTVIDGAVGTVPWLEYCGSEIGNGARTVEYIRNAQALGQASRLELPGGGVCSVLYRPNGTPEMYLDPASDPAPWYDANRPESAYFLGFIITDMSGFDSTAARSSTDRPTRFGGSVLGPLRHTGRRITVTGVGFAMSYAGQEYGKRWLTHVLATAACDPCGECLARVRLSCPPDDGSYDALSLWGLYDVGLVDGPHYTPGLEGCPEYFGVEFTIVAGDPYLYRGADICVDSQILNPHDVAGGSCISFDTWLCGPGGGLQCCKVSPPQIGTISAVVTIDAPDGVGDIVIATYAKCPPDPAVDEPVHALLVPGLLGRLVIDSSRHAITYTDPSGSVADGTPFVQLPSGGEIGWTEVSDCDPAACVCVSTLAPASGGSTTKVTIETQERSE